MECETRDSTPSSDRASTTAEMAEQPKPRKCYINSGVSMDRLAEQPTGSLAQIVKKYYQVFQQGYVVPDLARRFAMAEWQQRVFLRNVVDDDIDLGNGLVGAENMAEQIKIYSALLRFLKLSLGLHAPSRSISMLKTRWASTMWIWTL